MASLREEILAANAAYAEALGDELKLATAPARGVAALTCMDSRIDFYRITGLKLGDAHIIRNAGGRASDDAIRSLVASHKLLGTNQWLVIHHTHCGMEMITDGAMAGLLEGSLATAVRDGNGWRNPDASGGSPEGRFINWLTYDDPMKAICADVARIRNHPLVNPAVPILAFVYDVETGRLNEVPAASALGRAR